MGLGFGAGIFFAGYLLLELPGTLLVERWSARKWFARIMVSWGMVAALSGLLGTPLFRSLRLRAQFYGARLLLGLAEAGFFSGKCPAQRAPRHAESVRHGAG
ncbi:hypothetical protein SBA4_7150003 [Candidatus Sulfopaludibacter sp. SbA4]|nr:hypothetical protein SBA4_7150003 [Candidatus Sulfopaludibacter sp. SbA4]